MKHLLIVMVFMFFGAPSEAKNPLGACMSSGIWMSEAPDLTFDIVRAVAAPQWFGCASLHMASTMFGCQLHANFMDISQSPWVIDVFPMLDGFCPGMSAGDNGSSADCYVGNIIQYSVHFVTYTNIGGVMYPWQYFNRFGYIQSLTCCT